MSRRGFAWGGATAPAGWGVIRRGRRPLKTWTPRRIQGRIPASLVGTDRNPRPAPTDEAKLRDAPNKAWPTGVQLIAAGERMSTICFGFWILSGARSHGILMRCRGRSSWRLLAPVR